MIAETFGQALRRFRTRAGMTVSELADALGASRRSIACWERDRRVPRDRARLLDLAQVLRLHTSEIEQLATIARRHPHQAGSESDFAPPAPVAGGANDVRWQAALHHQLRAPIIDFTGRSQQIAQLIRTLQKVGTGGVVAAISGVQGMGGIGKTELAYLVAHHVRGSFPDAQIVVNLRGSHMVPLSTAQALRTVIHTFMPEMPLPDDLEALQARYQAMLHEKRALILADDTRDAAQVRPLLPPSGCALLITSRQRFSLPGMSPIDLEQLSIDESVTLLCDICARLAPDAALTIARACGFLPLALRVSGSILHNDPALDVLTYIRHLTDERQRLAQLRDPDDPHLDVAASLAASYAQLDEVTQRVFRQLGVFIGDFVTAQAQAVVEVPVETDVEAILHHLLRRNLVMYDTASNRWQLHDLLRDLARGYLDVAGETHAVAERYARHAVQIMQAIDAQYLMGGESLLVALARFDEERHHIDATWRWAMRHAGVPAADTLLLEALSATRNIAPLRYNGQYGQLPQLEQALAAAQRLSNRHSERTALVSLGLAYWNLGDPRRSIPYYKQALGIAQALGDRCGEGMILTNLANAYVRLGDAERGIPFYEQALSIARALGDQRGEGRALHNLGLAYHELGVAPRAITYFELALQIAQELGEWYGECTVHCGLGFIYVGLGVPQRGARAGQRALTIAKAIRDRRFEGYALQVLGQADAALQNLEFASSAFAQALALFHEIGDRHGEAMCRWKFGLALVSWGQRERALPFLRAAVAYKQEIGHTQAAAHAALLAQMEVRDVVSAEQLQREVGMS